MDISINLSALVRERLDSLLITASWFPELKNHLGLQGVSPIWQDSPAFYFWLKDAPCVFSLVLEQAVSEQGLLENYIHCEFIVRAFPFKNTNLYHGLSKDEKKVINSPIFDGSNTPCFERIGDLDKNLFILSSIKWLYGKSGLWSAFSLNALDSCVTRSDVALADLLNSRCQTGTIVLRKIPSWQISLPLFDVLNSLYALYSKQKPRRVRLTSRDGFEFFRTLSGEMKVLENDSIQDLILMSLFVDEHVPNDPELDRIFEIELSSDSEKTIFDRTFNNDHIIEQGLQLLGYENKVGRNWWIISDSKFESSLTCPCGCSHD